MLFSKGRGRFSDPRHIRRARGYLEEARMAVLEHSIAAEHYQAMAAMYAQRVARLEREIAEWEQAEAGGPHTEIAAEVPVARVRTEQDMPEQRLRAGTSTGVVMPMPGGEAPRSVA